MNRIPLLASLFAVSLAVLVIAPQASAQDHDTEHAEHPDHGDHANHDNHHAHMEAMENTEIADPDIILEVEGMHCEHCAYSLRSEFESLDAVDQTQVIVEDNQQIRIALNEGQTLSEEDIQEIVRASGFEDTFELKGMRFPK